MPSCKGLRQELIDCLLISDCVVVEKKGIKECLQGDQSRIDRYGPGGDGVPEKCRQIQRAHQICVRGMLDKRNRIIGFKGY